MITSAACRAIINNNEVVVIKCHRHCDFFETMKLLHVDYDKASVEQGFIDWNEEEQKEEFVSRVEAFKRAQISNQIPKWKEPTQLFSEDLY